MSNAIARKLDSIQRKSAMRSVDVANVVGARPETVSRWNQGKAFPRPDAQKLLLELEYERALGVDAAHARGPQRGVGDGDAQAALAGDHVGERLIGEADVP